MNKINKQDYFPYVEKAKLDVSSIKFESTKDGSELSFDFSEKKLIVDKLLQSHNLACANVKAGNITGRGFATSICTSDDFWFFGTNFNNTRNDISSVCGERSAILSAYNSALLNFSLDESDNQFDFKIKYLCMSSSLDLNSIYHFIFPCEDCLSWLNTNRYFDEETLIFSFERRENEELKVIATRLIDLLPYRNIQTSNAFDINKKVNITNEAYFAIEKFNLSPEKINELIKTTYDKYCEESFAKVSNQNIAVSIISNNKIFSAKKLDWTKRWHVEPLEYVCTKAIEEQGDNLKIRAICYFGDEYSNNKFKDGVVSIKSLGRIRQKYATKNTVLILNLENEVLITTLGEYLPHKFVQGYKI